MLDLLANCWKIPELRKRIIFTMALLFLCRVAATVPCPGIDADQLGLLFKMIEKSAGSAGDQLAFGLNIFTGGALSKFAVATLGIMPYITASIIIQVLTPALPALQKLKRDGESGFQKINQLTRYLTLIVCAVQGYFVAVVMQNPGQLIQGAENLKIVTNPGVEFQIMTVIIVTCGTMILMWLGEQITEKGIGQGASLIITVGIIEQLPTACMSVYSKMRSSGDDNLTIVHVILLIVLFILVTAAVVAISLAVRRIPIQYARARATKSSMGNRSQASYFPLKVNYAGVMPIIFASALLMVPSLLIRFFSQSQVSLIADWRDAGYFKWILNNSGIFDYGTSGYMMLYAAMILGFCFFWVASQFNPSQVADDLNRSGAFVPGYRAGEETAKHIDWTMTRVTTAGAIFLTIISVLPMIFNNMSGSALSFSVANFFGGASLLIIVSVMLDTCQHIHTHIITYGGYEEQSLRRQRRRGHGEDPGDAPVVPSE